MKISDYELLLYIDGWYQFTGVLGGRKKPAPTSEFVEEAKKRVERFRKKMEQQKKDEKKEMTLDETVRWLENAGNSSNS